MIEDSEWFGKWMVNIFGGEKTKEIHFNKKDNTIKINSDGSFKIEKEVGNMSEKVKNEWIVRYFSERKEEDGIKIKEYDNYVEIVEYVEYPKGNIEEINLIRVEITELADMLKYFEEIIKKGD